MRTQILTAAAFLPSLLLPRSAFAQQFQQVTTFPGSAVWSEGVECADVDQDGDLDIFVADGDGFTTAGTQRQSRLFINRHIEGQTWTIVDESVARLGVHVSNAKGVTTGDIDGDGWVDALYSNAFFNNPPFLYVNVGSASPGFFTFEGAARGFTTSYSSGSAMFADLDDDGDLDVIINDRYNSGTSAKPHLFLNDGTGHFTENAAALGAANKSSQMDVQLVDIDGDWDFDFFGPNKATAAPAHYLMLNNGAGVFSDSSSLLSPASGGTYEAEAGDLDGDQDLDLFFVSLAGFAESSVRNNLVPGGTLTFTNQSTFGGDDDNEIVLFDYDNDGDYDVIVGSLRNGSDKLYRNNGGLSFTDVSAQIQTSADSTLDATAADLNNDGAYDLITVQGESGNFTNKFYRNTGAPDTLPPVVLGTLAPVAAPGSGPWVVKARARDQVLDDGVDYVTGSATYVVATVPAQAAVSILPGGAFSTSSLAVSAGTGVVWTNTSGAAQNVNHVLAPYLFDSGALADAASFETVLVTPGTYVFTNSVSAGTCTVTVTGAPATGAWRKAGHQIHRFTLADTAGGAGAQVSYELRLRDWPGNVRAVTGRFGVTPVVTGTTFCAGDGSATPCPCGNSGAAGRGCANSVDAAGARLQATGSASLTADGLVLAGVGMPNSSALYFQGTAQQNGGLGTAFGDGLRCAGGAVVRLGTKTNTAGASNYPVGADLPVSVRGAIAAPGTRHYQIWYRNAASFCQPETFNLSNGLSVAWGA